MQPFRPRKHPLPVSSHHYIEHSWGIEVTAQEGPDQTASRHDEQMLTARQVPVDPYRVWLDRREADRRSATAAELTSPADRLSRSRPRERSAIPA
jgi:hypothetical protein